MTETTIDQEPPRPAGALPPLADRWALLKQTEPKLRTRDAAEKLGVSEAELVATGCPTGAATRLDADMGWLIEQIPSFGEVMALTRNDTAVHEKVGRYDNVTIRPHGGLVLNNEIDLRLFIKHWRHCLALKEATNQGTRRSLQFFDGSGRAVHKVFLRPESDTGAFDRLVESCRAEDQSGALEIRPPRRPAPDRADEAIDLAGLRAGWEALQDTHDFHGLLRRFKAGRQQALRLIGDDLAYRLSASSLRACLERAAERKVPVMVFVGNDGCIQIHSGPVARTVVMGTWFNVLDPGFNLHVREDRIAHAWLVRKPTSDGVLTSLEFYDLDERLFLTMFGVRKPGMAEDDGWRRLAEDLPRHEPDAAT